MAKDEQTPPPQEQPQPPQPTRLRTQAEIESDISLQLANSMIRQLTQSLAAKQVEYDQVSAKLAAMQGDNNAK